MIAAKFVMLQIFLGISLLLSLCIISCAAVQVDIVPESDLQQLIQKLKGVQPYKDLASAYYSVTGLDSISEKIPEKQVN